MRHHRESKFRSNDSGAVAAAYALALPALIAIAGVGFDYARMAGMDSELQNAADQAALAAASQLDGQAGACGRASAAAVGLVTNQTLLASGAGAVTISAEATCDGVGNIRFFQNKAKTTAATSDGNARFVEVFVNARRVDYALLPVVMPGQSALIQGIAFAGLGSALCKVPPVMMCNPNETADYNFTTANYIGTGVRLITQDGGGTYGQGVFGYLETDAGSGANITKQLIGAKEVPGNCSSTTTGNIKPGLQLSVMDYFNTRFDIYANGLGPICGTGGVNCPPSANSKIDLLKGGNASQCELGNGNGSNGWRTPVAPYRPTSPVNALSNAAADLLSPMGYPRDMCHAVSKLGSCTGGGGGKVGDGNWDRNAYFRSNTANWSTVPNFTSVFGTATPSRYQVYKYEAANGKLLSQADKSGPLTAHSGPVCGAPGIPVAGASPDRRVLSVALINCLNNPTAGSVGPSTTNATIQKFVDVFLVEPSETRGSVTEKSDVYVEIIGETKLGGGANAGQSIKKDVPYLIE